MAVETFTPTSWNGEIITNSKLQRMSDNDQWLFENMPRIRYSTAGIVRDRGLKIITGKTPLARSTANWSHTHINFGTFFTIGCKPVVNVTLEVPQNNGHRARVTLIAKNGGGEVDHTGFVISLSSEQYTQMNFPAIGHWTAIGF